MIHVPAVTTSAVLRLDARRAPTARSASARTAQCSQPACAAQSRPAPANSAGRRGISAFSACGPPVEMPITTMSTAPRARRSGAAVAARTRRTTDRDRTPHVRLAGRLDFLDQLVGESRAAGRSPARSASARSRPRPASSAVSTSSPDFAGDADDDDRHRAARHLLADEADAVELRHDQVAGDDVGLAARRPAPAPRGRRAPRRRLRRTGCATASASRPCGRRPNRRRPAPAYDRHSSTLRFTYTNAPSISSSANADGDAAAATPTRRRTDSRATASRSAKLRHDALRPPAARNR